MPIPNDDFTRRIREVVRLVLAEHRNTLSGIFSSGAAQTRAADKQAELDERGKFFGCAAHPELHRIVTESSHFS